jgi:hypothetical protein
MTITSSTTTATIESGMVTLHQCQWMDNKGQIQTYRFDERCLTPVVRLVDMSEPTYWRASTIARSCEFKVGDRVSWRECTGTITGFRSSGCVAVIENDSGGTAIMGVAHLTKLPNDLQGWVEHVEGHAMPFPFPGPIVDVRHQSGSITFNNAAGFWANGTMNSWTGEGCPAGQRIVAWRHTTVKQP